MFSAFAQKRTVEVGSFTEFSLGIPANVYIKQGSNEQLQIECDDDLFEKIEIEQSGSELTIRKKGKSSWKDGWKNAEVTVWITMKEIEELSLSGSGDMKSEGELQTEDLQLSVSGSGDMDLELSSSELGLRISGSGSLTLKGEGTEADAKISGSGKVKAEDLTVKSFKASISGSGNCYITATDEVSAKISGSGSVYYAGDPARINSNSSGSGKVKKM